VVKQWLASAALLISIALPRQAFAEAPRAVVFIGGFGSDFGGTVFNFAGLASELVARGWSREDLYYFSYDPAYPEFYAQSKTCQPLAVSKDKLGGMLLWLRDVKGYSSVALVGHSMGGVLAWDILDGKPELSRAGAPLIRSVITVDSPLGGVGSLDGLMMQFMTDAPTCPVADELQSRLLMGEAWQKQLNDGTLAALGRGVRVSAIVNDADAAVLPYQQALPPAVNYQVNLRGLGLNHIAVLATAAGVALIADLLSG
jgi:pimeloyl-ACP methyl ester carboxylesterase